MDSSNFPGNFILAFCELTFKVQNAYLDGCCFTAVTDCGDFACVEIWFCLFIVIKDVIAF